jgi:hypothetical protein
MPIYSHMAQQQQQGGDTPCGQSKLGSRYTAEKHQIYRDDKKKQSSRTWLSKLQRH